MSVHLRTAALCALLAAGLLCGCSEEARRERDVKGFLRCITLGDDACVGSMTCTAYPEAFSTDDLVQAARSLEDNDPERLRLVGTDARGGDVQYNYELDGKKLYVRFCPEGYDGTIATLVVSE